MPLLYPPAPLLGVHAEHPWLVARTTDNRCMAPVSTTAQLDVSVSATQVVSVRTIGSQQKILFITKQNKTKQNKQNKKKNIKHRQKQQRQEP